MADVFVSYKREDDQAVSRLVKALRADGLSVWWDRDIPTGAPWEDTIEREHGLAKCLVVCWSKASVLSENVKAEARKARSANRLVQTFIEPCEPPMFFGERQGIDLTGWNGRADDPRVKAILAAVRATIEGKPTAEGVGVATGRRKSLLIPLAAGLGALAVLGVAAAAVWMSNRPTPTSAEPSPEARTLAAVEGRWGVENRCERVYRYSVTRDQSGTETRIVAEGPETRHEGRVVSITDGAILTEALTPVEERGRLVDIRPEANQLVLQDRSAAERIVMIRCP